MTLSTLCLAVDGQATQQGGVLQDRTAADGEPQVVQGPAPPHQGGGGWETD